jgi:uncharacterized protein (DUF433 family)
VLELLGAGASFDEILQDYPFLEREDILVAIEYAARQLLGFQLVNVTAERVGQS